ncbi:MAG: iron ABC transporter substrate-binding protein [Chloroflexi bacterium]|nr:iron ABC transporter substrate-binding protein [Chloroflexota bacterium]
MVLLVTAASILLLGLAACSAQATPRPQPLSLTVYSGRGEELVGPAFQQFQQATGIEVKVRYGSTSELATTLLEEGKNSPADVYWAQDAGALGALSKAGRLIELPEDILGLVDSKFRSHRADWVGITGRARVMIYNTQKLKEADLPDDIWGFTDAKWKGRIGWAPTNGSFQAFVTALRVLEGEARARQWLNGIQANQPKTYPSNYSIVIAVGRGEVDTGFVNHYYLFRALKEEGEAFPARNYYPRAGDAGALINVAGVGVLDSSKNREVAFRFVRFLLSEVVQSFFAGDRPDDAFEYPLVPGVATHPLLTPLDQIKTPNIDLADLSDLEGTLKLLRETGVLP